jgi:hypothetical protein
LSWFFFVSQRKFLDNISFWATAASCCIISNSFTHHPALLCYVVRATKDVHVRVMICLPVAQNFCKSEPNYFEITGLFARVCAGGSGSRRCRDLYYIASNGRMINMRWIGKDLEVSGCDPTGVHVPGGTEETHEKICRDSGCPVRDSNRAPPQYESVERQHITWEMGPRNSTKQNMTQSDFCSRRTGVSSSVRHSLMQHFTVFISNEKGLHSAFWIGHDSFLCSLSTLFQKNITLIYQETYEY